MSCSEVDLKTIRSHKFKKAYVIQNQPSVWWELFSVFIHILKLFGELDIIGSIKILLLLHNKSCILKVLRAIHYFMWYILKWKPIHHIFVLFTIEINNQSNKLFSVKIVCYKVIIFFILFPIYIYWILT